MTQKLENQDFVNKFRLNLVWGVKQNSCIVWNSENNAIFYALYKKEKRSLIKGS